METTHWQNVRWKIPLSSPPEIVQIGVRVHGQTPVERYKMIGLWSLHLYRYDAELSAGAIDLPIHPGYAGISPPDTPMVYRFHGRAPHIFVHFRCQASSLEDPINISAMQDLGDSFGRIYEQMLEAIEGPSHFAQARLWDVLWQLTRRAAAQRPEKNTFHPAVSKTMVTIDQNLSDTLKAAALADSVGVSASYLSRLFQQTLGKSIVSYIQERRLSRATHLLQKSTLPIKTIAIMVGIADLQHFNRTMHRLAGKSPSQIRADGGWQAIEDEIHLIK